MLVFLSIHCTQTSHRLQMLLICLQTITSSLINNPAATSTHPHWRQKNPTSQFYSFIFEKGSGVGLNIWCQQCNAGDSRQQRAWRSTCKSAANYCNFIVSDNAALSSFGYLLRDKLNAGFNAACITNKPIYPLRTANITALMSRQWGITVQKWTGWLVLLSSSRPKPQHLNSPNNQQSKRHSGLKTMLF